MVTLSLFRHAKSAWNRPFIEDFERPLARRGQRSAPKMGRYMAAHDLEPDYVLCSAAKRARQTLELASKRWKSTPEIQFAEALYHAGIMDMLRIVQSLPETYGHVMLVGHNPGFQALACGLVGGGDRAGLGKMAANFPTGALAVIDFEDGWPNVRPGTGRLRCFVVPRELPAR